MLDELAPPVWYASMPSWLPLIPAARGSAICYVENAGSDRAPDGKPSHGSRTLRNNCP